jgi:hypothetical protein
MQYLFICLWCLFIHYGIIWKELLELWSIPTYHEYIWLGIATISLTTLSNSLKNTKKKREQIVSILSPLQLSKIQIHVLYNHIFIIGLVTLIILGIISNQKIIVITLGMYILNIFLEPLYFIASFEIAAQLILYISNYEYYYLAGFIICYLLFIKCSLADILVKENITTLLCIKIVGIFIHIIYGNFLCK